MEKTTVYLTPELKRALTRLARQRGCSEAELLREAVGRLAGETAVPVPRLPLFRSTGPSIAEAVEQALQGFGLR
ncbi:MAG TPA: CopG family transcriptional regulator [Vicinamibacterales bacterium]|nr:CopG family transcriptional regulator [Vicinamibacterales bacterium]